MRLSPSGSNLRRCKDRPNDLPERTNPPGLTMVTRQKNSNGRRLRLSLAQALPKWAEFETLRALASFGKPASDRQSATRVTLLWRLVGRQSGSSIPPSTRRESHAIC